MAQVDTSGARPPPVVTPITLTSTSEMMHKHIQEILAWFMQAPDDEVKQCIIESIDVLNGALSKISTRAVSQQQPSPTAITTETQSRRPSSMATEPQSEQTVSDNLSTDQGRPQRKRQRTSKDQAALELPLQQNKTTKPVKAKSQPRQKRGSGSVTIRAKSNQPEQFAISAGCGPKEITRMRHDYFADLLKIELTQKHDGKEEAAGFSEELAQDLTDYLFDEVMGPDTLQRLTDFAQAYSPTNDEDEIDAGAAARLKKLAHDKSAPLVLRRFFGTFTHQQRARHTHPTIQNLHQVILSRELFVHYERVKSRLESGDKATIDFLKAHGLQPTVGRGWNSVGIDFLADMVGLTRGSFLNTCERAKGINQFVDQFGEGILPLLPPNAMSKLRRFGNQRMGPAYELLKRHVPLFRHICDLTEELIYRPFIQGKSSLRLDAARLIQPKSRTLIDIITEASTESLDIPNDEDYEPNDVGSPLSD